ATPSLQRRRVPRRPRTGCAGPSPSPGRPRFYWDSARLSASAWARRTALDGSAWNTAAAWLCLALKAPASFERSTSRDSRSASLVISSGVIGLPSMTPPLITSCAFSLAKSRSPLAASTTSPLTKAMAEGPLSRSRISLSVTPASLAVSLFRVFFATRERAFWPGLRRSWVSCATVSPRYSFSTAPLELWNSSLSSATAAALSGLGMGLLPTVNTGRGPRAADGAVATEKAPAQAHGAQDLGRGRTRHGSRSSQQPARAARHVRDLRS